MSKTTHNVSPSAPELWKMEETFGQLWCGSTQNMLDLDCEANIFFILHSYPKKIMSKK